MKARYAREIRAGIDLARGVYLRHDRRRPNFGPRFEYTRNGRYDRLPSLLERAYLREQSAMVGDGRIRPPSGPSPLASQLEKKPPAPSLGEAITERHNLQRPVDISEERHLPMSPDGRPVVADLAGALADDLRAHGLAELLSPSFPFAEYVARQAIVELHRSLERIAGRP